MAFEWVPAAIGTALSFLGVAVGYGRTQQKTRDNEKSLTEFKGQCQLTHAREEKKYDALMAKLNDIQRDNADFQNSTSHALGNIEGLLKQGGN